LVTRLGQVSGERCQALPRAQVQHLLARRGFLAQRQAGQVQPARRVVRPVGGLQVHFFLFRGTERTRQQMLECPLFSSLDTASTRALSLLSVGARGRRCLGCCDAWRGFSLGAHPAGRYTLGTGRREEKNGAEGGGENDRFFGGTKTRGVSHAVAKLDLPHSKSCLRLHIFWFGNRELKRLKAGRCALDTAREEE
jgi:hypothetical protein